MSHSALGRELHKSLTLVVSPAARKTRKVNPIFDVHRRFVPRRTFSLLFSPDIRDPEKYLRNFFNINVERSSPKASDSSKENHALSSAVLEP